MIAFVLSGGGNRGALEAGALRALFEAGITPDLLVGTSAGALNAVSLATQPDLRGAERLVDLWLSARSDDIFPGNLLTQAVRFVTGQDSLYPNSGLRKFAAKNLDAAMRTFGDITKVKLYLIAANLNTATLYLFGDDPSASLIDAALASAAVPPFLPPVQYLDWQYVDGAMVSNVPISVALDRGANVIYAVNVGYAGATQKNVHGILPIATQALQTLVYQQLIDDLEHVATRPDVTLHHVQITAFGDVPPTDFSRTREMVDEGHRVMKDYLSGTAPQAARPRPERPEAPPPPGAQIYRRKPPLGTRRTGP